MKIVSRGKEEGYRITLDFDTYTEYRDVHRFLTVVMNAREE